MLVVKEFALGLGVYASCRWQVLGGLDTATQLSEGMPMANAESWAARDSMDASAESGAAFWPMLCPPVRGCPLANAGSGHMHESRDAKSDS